MVENHALRQFREGRGLTKEALGRELGVSGVTIARWENGERAPRRRDVPRIAEYTGLTPSQVLGFEPDVALVPNEAVE